MKRFDLVENNTEMKNIKDVLLGVAFKLLNKFSAFCIQKAR